MLSKFIAKPLILTIAISINNPLLVRADIKISSHRLINKFCITALRSKTYLRKKENFDEISDFTCKCFIKKFQSGYSIKHSKFYCKKKATEKYNL